MSVNLRTKDPPNRRFMSFQVYQCHLGLRVVLKRVDGHNPELILKTHCLCQFCVSSGLAFLVSGSNSWFDSRARIKRPPSTKVCQFLREGVPVKSSVFISYSLYRQNLLPGLGYLA